MTSLGQDTDINGTTQSSSLIGWIEKGLETENMNIREK